MDVLQILNNKLIQYNIICQIQGGEGAYTTVHEHYDGILSFHLSYKPKSFYSALPHRQYSVHKCDDVITINQG